VKQVQRPVNNRELKVSYWPKLANNCSTINGRYGANAGINMGSSNDCYVPNSAARDSRDSVISVSFGKIAYSFWEKI
jgi:hypothetical protein